MEEKIKDGPKQQKEIADLKEMIFEGDKFMF